MLTRNAHTDEARADARLGALLDAASAPAEPGPAPGEEAALAAFRASCVRTDGWRSRMHLPTTPLKSLSVAAVGAGLALTGGLAAASAGALPGAAQDTAHDMLAEVGVVVPGANEHSAGNADTRGQSEDAAADTSGATEAPGTLPDAAAFGQMISELAQNTAGGPGKGATISEAAKSHGKAGEHGPATAPEQSAASGDHAQAPDTAGPPAEGDRGQSGDHATVEKPSVGGSGTADGATADADGGTPSSRGTGTADEKSGGRSTAGSGNAP